MAGKFFESLFFKLTNFIKKNLRNTIFTEKCQFKKQQLTAIIFTNSLKALYHKKEESEVIFICIVNVKQRNWVFATNSAFVRPISLQPYDVNLTLFDLTEFIVWNIKDLRHWVATILKLENQSLWQKLYSFQFFVPPPLSLQSTYTAWFLKSRF